MNIWEYILEHPFLTMVMPLVIIVMTFLLKDINQQIKHNHFHDNHNNNKYHSNISNTIKN